ncbi:MAG: efflux RND transporter periplasmic adaptor subunit [Planctomycetota bacterium]
MRRNLGIEFVKVERRRVAQTLRLPGHFELLPAARHEQRVPVAGRVEALVAPLQQVKAGDPLYRLDSPEWRAVQKELGEIATQVKVARARIAALQPLVAAHLVHEGSLQNSIAVMAARVENLEATRASVGGQAPELSAARVQQAEVSAQHAEAIEKRAETDALLGELQANVAAGEDRFRLALGAAATLVSMPVEELERATDGVPAWRRLTTIELRAAAAGIVDRLPAARGVWVESGELVMTITDLAQVRFRARGMQSDLPSLQPELPARVVLPQGNAQAQQYLSGNLLLGVEADPAQRTIDVFLHPEAAPAWARPGIAAFLEVETRGGKSSELAIPLSSVLQDGLQRVLFRRDPADPDKVIRVEADLGLDDGRWVEVKSGLADGDEVVLAGAYELMLASSGSAAKGGHFHADGTFHEGKDK